MSTRACLAAFALLFVSSGCIDVGVVTRPSGSPLTTSIAPAPESEGGDPEPQWPTAIHRLDGDILMPWADEQYPAQAIVSGFMRYDSYHARISARANITGRNPQMYEFYPEERHQFWGFFDNAMNAQWEMYVGGPCGNVVELNLRGEVWWMYQGGWNIDSQDRTQPVSRRQPECPEPTPGGGEGGKEGGGGTYRCYTYTVDHYWYYPDTGRYEYRGTTEQSWCESLEH
jgi:hypothetical protein